MKNVAIHDTTYESEAALWNKLKSFYRVVPLKYDSVYGLMLDMSGTEEDLYDKLRVEFETWRDDRPTRFISGFQANRDYYMAAMLWLPSEKFSQYKQPSLGEFIAGYGLWEDRK